MQRTKNQTNSQPDFIITGDWHLREDQPECRTDNFWKAQWQKVDFIADLQSKYDCPVLHSGDLFHHWKPSPYLLSETIKHLPSRFYTIYGNHDLPQHNLDLANKCGVNVLWNADKLTVLDGVHWGQQPEKDDLFFFDGYSILIWHTMTYTGKPLWPGMTDPKAEQLLKKYTEYKLIITGHNHQSFTAMVGDRILVNPGSITRQTAAQIDHQPCIYLWYEKENRVVSVPLPAEEGVVSREHIERKESHNTRIESFVNHLNVDWGGLIGFEENVERMMRENNIKQEVKDVVYKVLDSSKTI